MVEQQEVNNFSFKTAYLQYYQIKFKMFSKIGVSEKNENAV